MTTWRYIIYLSMHLFMHFSIYALVWKKEKLYKNSYTNFISEVINIDFWRIWHFDVKGTEWVGLEHSIVLALTPGRFNMWVTPYTGILTLTKLKYFMSKDLNTKALKSYTATNYIRRHSEHGKIHIIWKV